jgi:broad specificity phosphatase PhoE
MIHKIPLLALAISSLSSAAFADTPIPPESKHRWDFRGSPHTITRDSFAKLFSCKTYEELRDALIAAIEDLEHEPDDPTPLYVASSCRLALIRTYYMLGEIGHADRLLEQYSIVHLDSEGNLDVSKVPLKPLPETKGEQGGTGQPATRSQSKSEGSDKPQPEAEGRSR